MSLSPKQYDKLKQALEWRLLGAKMYRALDAFHLASRYMQNGKRKNGEPSLIHEVSIAHFALTLKGVEDMLEDLLCVIFCHDLMEDYNVTEEELRQIVTPEAFAAIWSMTKTYDGVKFDDRTVFFNISRNLLAALAKGLDRINNYQSMTGTFTNQKQLSYMAEGYEHFMPMLKAARKNFVKYTDAFLNIETMLRYQLQLLEVINNQPGQSV